MSPEDRARALREAMDAEFRTINGDIGWTILIIAAIRAAEDEALERANEAIERIPAHRGAEMAMKRAAWNAVNALKSKPPEGK